MATYNVICGCGGSMYICPAHYNELIEEMNHHPEGMDGYLNEHSW